MYAFRRFEFWVLSFELKRQRPREKAQRAQSWQGVDNELFEVRGLKFEVRD
jgi:hypothetical protein